MSLRVEYLLLWLTDLASNIRFDDDDSGGIITNVRTDINIVNKLVTGFTDKDHGHSSYSFGPVHPLTFVALVNQVDICGSSGCLSVLLIAYLENSKSVSEFIHSV